MAKYAKDAGKNIKKAVRKERHTKLKSGSGKKVTTREQAIAGGLSEAKKEGAKASNKSGNKSAKNQTKKSSKKSSSKSKKELPGFL